MRDGPLPLMSNSDNDNEQLGDLNEDLALLLDDQPSLRALPAVIRLVHDRPWFANLGAPASADDVAAAETYMASLGFPDIAPAFLDDPRDVQEAVSDLDVNDTVWDAEEQLRAALTVQLVDILGEEVTQMVMAHLASETGDVLMDAARVAAVHAGFEDEDFLQAAFGAAAQACHQAALVALAGEPDHPFSHRFRLFELGRWPLAVAGRSFLMY